MSRRQLAWFSSLAVLSVGVYLVVSWYTYRLGFPLDDAWIHQTYARNLALRGDWSYNPGEPSAGSTAPLWSVLLFPGYRLGLSPFAWAYLSGWGLLTTLALSGMYLYRSLKLTNHTWAWIVGIGLIFEWHLTWSAVSGMETLLEACLVLVVMIWLTRPPVNWMVVGAICGLGVWIRPDALTLVGPVGVIIHFYEKAWSRRLQAAGWTFLGIGLFFLPYLLFNRWLAGAWWPNTFYAKQVEYSIYRDLPLWRRWLSLAGTMQVGVGAVLLPGFIRYGWLSLRQRYWPGLVGQVWVLGYVLLYALFLPVTYQHGRYLIPAMPLYFIYGSAGMAGWIDFHSSSLLKRVLSKSWALAAGLVLCSFWMLGAQAYGRDVAFIESEMVDTACWVARNIPTQARLAAHDIGALGYYGDHYLIDLAGLVSPQVIPILRDEPELQIFLDETKADYLITFPGWYPYLTQQAEQIYLSKGKFSPMQGGENMAVYRWRAR